MHHTAAHPYHLGKRCIASRATSSAQDCSDDILRLHQQPLYLREYINDHLPARSLRSTNKMLLTTATTKTETAARAFRAAAPKIWNSLPVIVKTATSLNQFSRLLKGHLFSHAFE